MFDGIDLSSCKLEELQAIVTTTASSMTSNLRRKFCDEPEEYDSSSSYNHKILGSNIDSNRERKDSGYHSSNDNTKECKNR